MTKKKAKGSGAYVNNHLAMRHKLLLGDWVKENFNSCQDKTYQEIADIAEKELGLQISATNVASIWVARFGNRNHSTAKNDRISYLEKRIAECERRLTEAGA